MTFNQVLEETKLFTNWTGKTTNIYNPDWTEYASDKVKKTKKNDNIQYAQDTVHYRDYMKTLKSGGEKPYLSWVNKVRVKI
jgi:hypothetical protein